MSYCQNCKNLYEFNTNTFAPRTVNAVMDALPNTSRLNTTQVFIDAGTYDVGLVGCQSCAMFVHMGIQVLLPYVM